MTAAAAKATREFTIKLDGVEYPVVVEDQGKPPWRIVVNGRTFTVKPEGGAVLVDGIVYDVTVDDDVVTAEDVSYPMEVSGLSVSHTGPVAAAVSAPSVAPRGGAGAIVAIMPGQVTRILVEEGQTIREGEAVCVLEAMKMENELRADRDGVVRAVHVQPSDDVEKGQVLVEIE